MTTTANRCHQGANVRRWREWRRLSQGVLAEKLGMSQSRLSSHEKTLKLEEELLNTIAKELDIPLEALTEMEEGATVNIFSGTFSDNAVAGGQLYQPTFNPVDKIIELYESLLQAERDKVSLLQEILKDKK